MSDKVPPTVDVTKTTGELFGPTRWVGNVVKAHWAIVLQDMVLDGVNQWFLAVGQGCLEGPQYLAPAERHLEGEGSFPSLRRFKT